MRVCPKCKKKYTDHPAISRKDNKTEICPECGTAEALEAYEKSTKKSDDVDDARFMASTICFMSQFADEDDDMEDILRYIGMGLKTIEAFTMNFSLKNGKSLSYPLLCIIASTIDYAVKNKMDVLETLSIVGENLTALSEADFIQWRAKMGDE